MTKGWHLFLLVACVLGLASGVDVVVNSHLSFDTEGAKNRPVSKVITLLKDMLKQLEKEQAEDEEIYDKMACWCETNDKEKTKAISDAEGKITDLRAKVEELTAASARLGAEIKNLQKEVADGQQSVDQATALRQKQLAEFNGEEKDLLESIQALKAAITVLAKHHGGSMAQVPRSRLKSLVLTLEREMQKHSALLKGVLSPRQRKAMEAFLQAPEDYSDAQPTFKQSYTPQSGEIFGILKQMKETFEANLSESQKEELANRQAYEELKTAKEAEIAAAQSQLDKKTQELADTDSKNAHAKQDIEDTTASLSADEQFLMMLKDKCQMTDKEWQERQKTRQEEMTAISEAISVLSSDDAHDLFTKTFNPAFLQERSLHSSRRKEASDLLLTVAKKTHNPRLATLAYRMRLDAFERVKKAIDDMVVQLQQQKADEIKQKDFCTDEFHQNQLQTEKKTRTEQDLGAKMDDLDMSIKTLGETVEGLKAEIADMQVQMKRAGENREKENADFQATITDQRETQTLLKKAITVLEGFYSRKQATALAQQKKQEPAGPPPPPGFSTYSKSEASGGVISLLKQILGDAQAMEAEAVRAEDDAQKAYEATVKDTNASIQSKSREIVARSEEKANAETELVQTREAKAAAALDLEQLSNYNAQLHQNCDFIVKNFEIRQTARDEEIEALKQAKAILSGANFQQFLQTA